MAEYFNSEKLTDKTISQHQRLKTTMVLPKSTFKKLDVICKILESNSRNTALEHAINFYFSYLTNGFNQDYLCDIYGNKISSEIKILADRMAKIQFKTAVEIDMLTRLVATDLSISKDSYEKLRKTSVDSVKQSHGTINIFEAANGE